MTDDEKLPDEVVAALETIYVHAKEQRPAAVEMVTAYCVAREGKVAAVKAGAAMHPRPKCGGQGWTDSELDSEYRATCERCEKSRRRGYR